MENTPITFVRTKSAPVKVSDMRSVLRREYDERPKRIVHNLVKAGEPWPRRTDRWCLHCCHPFDTMPLPLIVRYDHQRDQAVGSGFFCSVNCILAYAREHQPIMHSQTMIYQAEVLRRSFGIENARTCRPALPREMLRVFQGDMEIDEFRANFQTSQVMRVETVSFAMQGTTVIEICPYQMNGVSVGVSADAEEEEMLDAMADKIIAYHRPVDMEDEKEECGLLPGPEQAEEQKQPHSAPLTNLEQFLRAYDAQRGIPDVIAPDPQ